MRLRLPLAYLLFGAAMCLHTSAASGADPPGPKADEWQVRTFRLPVGHWWRQRSESVDPFGEPGGKRNATPLYSVPLPLPSDDATEQEWTEFIGNSSHVITQLMNLWGISVPEGSLFLHDVASGTMAVRSTPMVMDQIEAMTHELVERAPANVGCSLDIVQADATSIRQLVAETAAKPDHTSTWKQVRTLIEQGKAIHVRHLKIETRSGQRANSSAGAEVTIPTGVKLDAAGRVAFTRTSRCAGTSLELEPVILADGYTVEASVTLEHHFASPVPRHEVAGQAGAMGRMEVPVTDYRCAKVKATVTFMDGTTKLFGVWTPEGSPEVAEGEVMQAAFLGMKVLRQLPEENTSLKGRIERYMAAKGLSPAEGKSKAPRKQVIPPGMVLESFKVPHDFLVRFYGLERLLTSKPDPKAPIDPFASDNPRPRDNRLESYLEVLGIHSPEGSYMAYVPTESRLVTVNTPENVELTRRYVEAIWQTVPIQLSHTLHIIEGDGPLIRWLAAQAQSHADHRSLWRQMEDYAAQGRVKLRRTMRLEGRSGEKTLSEAGTLRMSAGALRFGDAAATPPDTGKPAVPKDGPAVSATATATPSSDLPLMMMDHDTRMTGTRLELHPTLGPDAWTVDVVVSLEHHFAPPTLRPTASATNAGVFRADLPTTDFHCARIATALVITKGMTKLLGVWTPEGAPEFEGKDIMQAAFLRVDVVPVRRE